MRAPQSIARWQWLAAPALGVAATAAFPPYGLMPLAPLALAALFALATPHGCKQGFALGWLFGFAHFASGVYWVYISTHVYGGAPWWLSLSMAVLLFAYMAVYPALTLALAARLGCWRDARGWLALPALWLLGELLRGWVFTGFPWLSLGYAAADTPLARLAPLAGVHGISAVLVFSAYALARSFGAAPRARAGMLAAALLPWLLALGLPRFDAWSHAQGRPLAVAIVQGNIAQDQKWKPEMQGPTLARYQQMTLAAADADLIVWPEVALTYRYDQVAEVYLRPIGEVVARQGGAVLAGIIVGEERGRGHYNSLVVFGSAEGRYDKRHLVPFGEFFPIPAFMRPLMDLLGTPYADLLFGAPEQAAIFVQGLRLGVSICFEDVFGPEIGRDARAAALLVNVTNDAWFGTSSAAHQHLQIARLRAMESGRTLVRAANTGISAVIGPDGALQARAGQFTTETLRAEVQPRAGVTPYARWGDGPLWLGALLVLGLTGLRRRPRAKT